MDRYGDAPVGGGNIVSGFCDRKDAGQRLAEQLRSYAGADTIVLALPRGGVPVGYEVARALGAPLDIWVVRKIGLPGSPEVGVGAVVEGGYVHLDIETLERLGLNRDELLETIEREQRGVEERVRRYRGDRPRPALHGRTVIVVDDGIATGGTVRAALHFVQAQAAKKIVLAVPVAAPETVRALAPEVDKIVCLHTPERLHAIGLWYVDFRQVPDDDVVACLGRARQEQVQNQHDVT